MWYLARFFFRNEESVPATQEIQSAAVPVGPLELWMEGVERVRRRLNKETEGAPRNYAERICSAFLDNLDKDLILDKAVIIGRLQKSAYRYENEVYALAGVTEEYQRASEVTKEVNVVLGWVEEILCYAMVDAQEVRKRYAVNEFMYQAK